MVQEAIQTKKAAKLTRLIEGLQKLTRNDQMVQFHQEKNDEMIICGSGDLHIKILPTNLRDNYAGI